MDEFSLIERYFKPLAQGFGGSLNLEDDAAIITLPPGHELVITKDAISEGIHFIGNENPALIAKKLLRVNLSDLAAKGAKPLAYFLALMLPKETDETWIAAFARGLAEDQKIFGIHLAGGDTTKTMGGASFSVTAIGTVATGKMLRRNDAKTGDTIYVSGTLGDSALGLKLCHPEAQPKDLPQQDGDPSLTLRMTNELIQRYLLPEPRLALGLALHTIAHASIDISDGLLQDLGHICKASNVGATIYRERIPLSEAARQYPDQWELSLSGGDDYELLFTADAAHQAAIAALANDLQLPITAIGSISEEQGVRLLDAQSNDIPVAHNGYQHF